MEDKEIILRVKQGDTEAFSLLVEKYHKKLLSFVYKIVREPDVVEDIGQEVFLKVFQSIDRFNPDSGTPFSAWLFVVARNQAITHLRYGARWQFTSLENILPQKSGRADPIELLLKQEDKVALHECLEQLSEPYRSTLIKSLEGKPINEIAQLHGMLPGTVKSRLHRAQKHLQLLMQKYLWSLK